VLLQLRPQFRTPEDFVARVAIQRQQAYRLLAVWDGCRPVALAGYRQLDNLIHGRFIYVDDLVTDAGERGHGHGERLIEALREIGRNQQCVKLVRDTALSNVLAQRFYFRAGLLARGLHFSMELQ
jgi:ribosomal protein S18 acetylase RimI-like enzyme